MRRCERASGLLGNANAGFEPKTGGTGLYWSRNSGHGFGNPEGSGTAGASRVPRIADPPSGGLYRSRSCFPRRPGNAIEQRQAKLARRSLGPITSYCSVAEKLTQIRQLRKTKALASWQVAAKKTERRLTVGQTIGRSSRSSESVSAPIQIHADSSH
jgi:hypothetical protein